MCELVESYARQVAEEEAAKAAAKAAKKAEEATARRLFEKAVDFDVVYQSVETLSKEELLSIYEEAKKAN